MAMMTEGNTDPGYHRICPVKVDANNQIVVQKNNSKSYEPPYCDTRTMDVLGGAKTKLRTIRGRKFASFEGDNTYIENMYGKKWKVEVKEVHGSWSDPYMHEEISKKDRSKKYSQKKITSDWKDKIVQTELAPGQCTFHNGKSQ